MALLAAAAPIAGAIISGLFANAAQNRQNQLIQQQQRDAERRYNQNYQRLADQLSGILADDYRAISPALVDQIVNMAADDIARGQARTNERILRDQARRGLAGHSLVDQRQAFVDSEANRALSDARTRAELEAANATAQQQAQARQLLAGVTADNFSAMNQAANQLIASQGQAANTYANLAAQLASPYLERWQDQWAGGGLGTSNTSLGSGVVNTGALANSQPKVSWNWNN